MKTNVRIEANVRLLVGVPLKKYSNLPKIFVSIVSETQAKVLINDPNQIEHLNSGEIINCQSMMEIHEGSGHAIANFPDLQLKKIYRGQRTSESVVEERFFLVFRTEFHRHGQAFNVLTLSLPVVVIVHGNQEPIAQAAVTWDNAFAENGSFFVPEEVPFVQVAEMLDMKWRSHCNTARGLTEDNIHYLGCKLFQNSNLTREEMRSRLVSKTLLYRDCLPGRKFSFWKWFYMIMKLTKSHLDSPWSNGYILGFADKADVQAKLLQSNPGTFILRFSDSELGGVSVAYVVQDNITGMRNVIMLEPFNAEKLSQHSLARSLQDLRVSMVYHESHPIPVETAFGRQSRNSSPPNNGYVGANLHVVPEFAVGNIGKIAKDKKNYN